MSVRIDFVIVSMEALGFTNINLGGLIEVTHAHQDFCLNLDVHTLPCTDRLSTRG